MRLAPRYLLIGNGRVAKHFQHYFSHLKIPFAVWRRGEPLKKLYDQAGLSSQILLLISDHAIEDFIKTYLSNIKGLCLHFSGSLISEQAFGAHPLMTFNKDLYNLNQYAEIPFVIDHDAPAFEQLLPGLPNPHVRLHKSLKAKYHALCVLSGNFSCLLWQKFFSSLENEFYISHEIGRPYFFQQMKNLIQDYKSALTGPLVRADKSTIEKNLNSLESDPFQEVYKSFVSCFSKIK